MSIIIKYDRKTPLFKHAKSLQNFTQKHPNADQGETIMQKLSRRQILKAISALPAVSPATSVLAQASNPQPQEWTGFAICDSCNHVPSCGIQFQAQGNNIISIQNWKENPRHWLCSKGMSTLQRLYNPNRLLYPMKIGRASCRERV